MSSAPAHDLWTAWQDKIPPDVCKRKAFRCGSGFDIWISPLLGSSHLRQSDKMLLLRAFLSGGVWNGLLLCKTQNEVVPRRFCSGPDGDGTFPGTAPYPLVNHRNNPEFSHLVSQDRSNGPSACYGMVGYPWAAAAGDLATNDLETSLGAHPVNTESVWCPESNPENVQDMVEDVPNPPLSLHPNIWSDGSRERIPHLHVEVAGAGFFHSRPCLYILITMNGDMRGI